MNTIETFVKRLLNVSCIVICLLLFSCVDNPGNTNDDLVEDIEQSAYVVCEGLFGQNNGTISRVTLHDFSVINNFFSIVNKGFKIGDTPNDLALHGKRIFVSVSGSNTLEQFDALSGKSLSRLVFGNSKTPRKIVILNDSTGFATCLNDDVIVEFNPQNMSMRSEWKTGPAPEGAAVVDGKIFCANSGYGVYRYKEALAGSISVFDIYSKTAIGNIGGLPNVVDVAASSKRNTVFALYRHLSIFPDSLGGLVEIDANTLHIKKLWRVKTPISLTIDKSENLLAFISDNSVFQLNLTDVDPTPEKLFSSSAFNLINGVTYNNNASQIWIANAKNFIVNGEIFVFDLTNRSILNTIPVGLNPSRILFFNNN